MVVTLGKSIMFYKCSVNSLLLRLRFYLLQIPPFPSSYSLFTHLRIPPPLLPPFSHIQAFQFPRRFSPPAVVLPASPNLCLHPCVLLSAYCIIILIKKRRYSIFFVIFYKEHKIFCYNVYCFKLSLLVLVKSMLF